MRRRRSNYVNSNEPLRYEAYVLHCWEVRSALPSTEATWRFSFEDPRTGEKHGFADLEALLGYLRGRLANSSVAKDER
jgi:hypothetical protein